MKSEASFFDWPSRHNVHLALPLLLIVSLALHIAGILVFQARHTPAQRTPERSATVYFLRPGSPEAARLAPVLAASDPALFAPGQPAGREIWNVPPLAYVPSYDASGPPIKPAPPRTAPTTLPPVAQSGPVGTRSAPPPPTTAPSPGPRTVVRFGGGLADRSFAAPEGFVFPEPLRHLRATEFLVAIAPDGRPLHLIPVPSASRNEAFERAALRYLAQGRFAPTDDADIVWGTATFHWGMP